MGAYEVAGSNYLDLKRMTDSSLLGCWASISHTFVSGSEFAVSPCWVHSIHSLSEPVGKNNFSCLPCVILMNKFELVIPWWLESRVQLRRGKQHRGS